MTVKPRMASYGPSVLSEATKRLVENYLGNMRREGLSLDVRKVIDSIRQQYNEKGWLTVRQIEVLRRCLRRSTASNPMGGFGQRSCFGRNAPAGRGSGPVG